MAGKRCAETFGGISGALWVEARGMRCVLSTVGARAGLWQEVLHGSLAMVFFFHFQVASAEKNANVYSHPWP